MSAVEVHHGDCLDVLKTLPDCSVDSVVTDPPYSLTDRRDENCASDMLRDAIVSDAAHDVAHLTEQFVPLSILCGASSNLVLGSVNLDAQVAVDNEEVDSDAPASGEHGEPLVNVGDAMSSEKSSGGEFRLWVRQGHARCVGACRCLRHGSDGRLRVPVRLRYNPPRQAKRAPGVVALAATELAAVLALDLAGRTGELLPASGADTLDPPFEILSSEPIGALARAGGLPPVLQSDRLGEIPDSAEGTVSFDLLVHRSALSNWRPKVLRGFMSSLWDGTGVETDVRLWRECLRVLKPGGHLLSFGGTRTWHRVACAIEDAGFEVRDSIAFMHGSGFPKSLDVGKAIDKRPGVVHHAEFAADLKAAMCAKGYTNTFDVAERVVGRRTGAVANWQKYQFPEAKWWPALRELLDMDEEKWGPVIAEAERVRTGQHRSGLQTGVSGVGGGGTGGDITTPATDAARRWHGWGTATKPAHEPVVVARKPLAKGLTVAGNVLEWGTGALNIDGCRIGTEVRHVTPRNLGSMRLDGCQSLAELQSLAEAGRKTPSGRDARTTLARAVAFNESTESREYSGRWPANVVVDSAMAEVLDQMSGVLHSQNPATRASKSKRVGTTGFGTGESVEYDDKGGASRFFLTAEPDALDNLPARFMYTAKAPKKERPSYVKEGSGNGRVTGLGGKVRQCNVCETRAIESGASEPSCGHGDFRWEEPTSNNANTVAHPTVKPLALMRWLVRLVTPPGGTVLEPFAGSGATVEACILEGFDCIAIEREAEYLPLIQQRINRGRAHVESLVEDEPELTLFDGDDAA